MEYKTYGEAIKAYRENHNLSMSEFAKIAGCSKAYIGMLERGINYKTHKKIVPSLTTLHKVSNAMGMKLSEFMKIAPYDMVKMEGSTEEEMQEALDAGTIGFENQCESYCEGVELGRTMGISKSDSEILQAIHDKPGMRIMFDVSKKATNADIMKAVEIIKAFYKANGGDEG